MPRSKALMKKRAGAGTGSKKIVIKPFSKPPTLPANYYETTSQALLQKEQRFEFAKLLSASCEFGQSSVRTPSLSRSGGPLSTRLSRTCLDQNRIGVALELCSKSISILCGLSLVVQARLFAIGPDDTWTADGQVWKRSSASASNGNHPVESATSNTQMGLWQVGLEQFRLRLESLEEEIYQTWWKSLQLDWQGQLPLDQLGLLQQTVYMWQDLG
eukprot:CAMPEP_0176103690 /NCGR_PEP_ID=MMETSP0120_2-20121206/52024_1 /TAXON_ID=160619 /ORGANISM="Kryptoperidinium foliaceum, Strain CCMP 1326" /LENGTH=214 /DNA_ID=CAMNT_0017437781 /DNA_START=304 /DNA_END=945 /DNA_ORIENTATION=+